MLVHRRCSGDVGSCAVLQSKDTASFGCPRGSRCPSVLRQLCIEFSDSPPETCPRGGCPGLQVFNHLPGDIISNLLTCLPALVLPLPFGLIFAARVMW